MVANIITIGATVGTIIATIMTAHIAASMPRSPRPHSPVIGTQHLGETHAMGVPEQVRPREAGDDKKPCGDEPAVGGKGFGGVDGDDAHYDLFATRGVILRYSEG